MLKISTTTLTVNKRHAKPRHKLKIPKLMPMVSAASFNASSGSTFILLLADLVALRHKLAATSLPKSDEWHSPDYMINVMLRSQSALFVQAPRRVPAHDFEMVVRAAPMNHWASKC